MHPKKGSIADLNTRKYAQPPSWEQIRAFIDESGMSMRHFERFYSMPPNHLAMVKIGQRNLAAAYWNIIYEKIKPAYGAGFIDDLLPHLRKNVSKKSGKPILSKNISVESSNDGHDRIGTLK